MHHRGQTSQTFLNLNMAKTHEITMKVTEEQEQQIRQLFEARGWDFKDKGIIFI